MPDRRESRFALEVLFLVALAVAVTVADLRSLLIAGVLALGWVLVAGVEWACWRDQPHYGSGLPPRWYVPRVDLPPPQPLEPVVSGYPEGRRDEAPTWIASAALREELLGDWPLDVPLEPEPEAAPEGVVALPPPPADAEPEAEPAVPQPVVEEPVVEEPVVEEPVVEEPAAAEAAAGPRLDEERAAEVRLARYSFEPLAEPPKRRFGRRGEQPPTIEVPALPSGPRALPSSREPGE